MVPEKIVRLDNLHIGVFGPPAGFRCAHSAPVMFELARTSPHFRNALAHPNLRPNPKNQWHADVEQPVRSKTETGWSKTCRF